MIRTPPPRDEACVKERPVIGRFSIIQSPDSLLRFGAFVLVGCAFGTLTGGGALTGAGSCFWEPEKGVTVPRSPRFPLRGKAARRCAADSPKPFAG